MRSRARVGVPVMYRARMPAGPQGAATKASRCCDAQSRSGPTSDAMAPTHPFILNFTKLNRILIMVCSVKKKISVTPLPQEIYVIQKSLPSVIPVTNEIWAISPRQKRRHSENRHTRFRLHRLPHEWHSRSACNFSLHFWKFKQCTALAGWIRVKLFFKSYLVPFNQLSLTLQATFTKQWRIFESSRSSPFSGTHNHNFLSRPLSSRTSFSISVIKTFSPSPPWSPSFPRVPSSKWQSHPQSNW